MNIDYVNKSDHQYLRKVAISSRNGTILCGYCILDRVS